ncbi:hypothetical protein FB451DRAFT_1568532 [Mycena latifolia]|nr:hypothetical protein FB451DRAFT_1568532 [Mycena latifolia]
MLYILWSTDYVARPSPELLRSPRSKSPSLSCNYYIFPMSQPPQSDSAPPLQRPATTNVLDSVLGSRKSWKTLHTGENVWPQHLEAALLEGLENHVPDDSMETRLLGRYRGRNQFISEYIFNKTGEYRSNRQVGSRLQQLRHCSSDPMLRRLLIPLRKLRSHSHEDLSVLPATNSVEGEDPLPFAEVPPIIPISIPILPQNSKAPHVAVDFRAQPPFNSRDFLQISDHPRDLQSIMPTVTFLSPYPVVAQSCFAVSVADQIVHTETVPLVILMDHPAHGTGFLHSTSLIPSYWNTILDSPDPSKFTIFQEIVKPDDSTIVFSARYQFVYPSIAL